MTLHSARHAAVIIMVVMLANPNAGRAQQSQCDIISVGVDTSLAYPDTLGTLEPISQTPA